jgi:XTP/dITP diphosphohydrolase
MQKLLIATKNPGKFQEILNVFEGLPIEFIFLGDLDVDDQGFAEDGETFLENAYKKAEFFGQKTGMVTLGEDSGILVNALVDELGVKTRRWGAGEEASDEEWIEYFMKRMKEEEDREAKFVCGACLWDKDRELDERFEGETKGEITEKLMAPILRGLPLSSCFKPEGMEDVYAALGAEYKNKISHRGKAISQVRAFLEKLIADAQE